MKLPRHVSLSIEHNDHKTIYQPVSEYLIDHEEDASDFVSEDSMKRAIETNELWSCHWYPDTPVGHCRIYAATLAELMEYLAKVE
jgi:hypothetical protein